MKKQSLILILLLLLSFLNFEEVMAQYYNDVSFNVPMTLNKTTLLDPLADLGANTAGVYSVTYSSDNDLDFSITTNKYSSPKPTSIAIVGYWSGYYCTFDVTPKNKTNFTIVCEVTYQGVKINQTAPIYQHGQFTAKVTYNVNVVEVNKIHIPTELSITLGDTYVFDPIIEETGAISELTWYSNNPSVASISNGELLAIAPGSSIIMCSADNGVTAQCNVTVNPLYVSNITLNKSELELTENTKEKLTATVLPDNATYPSVRWSSTNSSVALVSQDGTITAVAPGYANIIATSTDGSDISASCLVHVVPTVILAEEISLDKTSLDMTLGEDYSLVATIDPSNVSSNDVNWSSSNPAVASVNNRGKVTAVGYGKATISATTKDGTNLSAECEVSVKPQAVSAFENIIFFEEAVAVAGKTVTVPLKMNNTAAISGVQFDVFLPEGMTIDAGRVVFNEEAERADASTHSLSCSLQPDGAYRLLCYSGSSVPFADNSGAIFDIPVTVAEGVESGEYYITFKDIVLTDKNGVQYSIDTYGSPLRIAACTPGDVNGDGKINVSDIVATANIILGKASSSAIMDAADMNGDGKVNVTDIVKIANYILGGGSSNSPHRAPAKAMANRTDNAMDILPFTIEEAGDDVSVTLDLHNPNDEFTAFECDLSLPEGFSIATNKRTGLYNVTFNNVTDRTDATIHTLSCSLLKNGDYKLLCYSNDLFTFFDNDGALVNIPLKTDGDLEDGVYEFVVKNIVLTQADETEVVPSDYYGTIIVGNGGQITDIALKGYYTKAVLSDFSAALADNDGVTSVDLTEAVDIDSKGSLTTGNPNTLIYISEGKALANAKNVVVGDDCDNLVLSDGYAFNAPKAFTAAEAEYKRTLSSGGWFSLCLPFDAYTPSDVTVERFDYVSADGTMVYFNDGKVEADVPCIFQSEAGTVTFSATNVKVNATPALLADGAFEGTYMGLPEGSIAGDYALRADGSGFGIANSRAYVTPFRAIIHSSNGIQVMRLLHNGLATGIRQSSDSPQVICANRRYNLMGQLVNETLSGIIIENGVKILVK